MAADLLNSDEIDTFWRDGFLVVDSPQLRAAEVEWCRRLLHDLLRKQTGREGGRYFDLMSGTGDVQWQSPQLLGPSFYATRLRTLSLRKAALGWARQLLGPEASYSGDQVILKPARNGGPTPWHQDEAFRDPAFDYNEISIWISLSGTLSGNGPMSYVPGTHLGPVLPHRPYGDPGRANTIECYDGFDPRTAMVCPIDAGAVIIHHCRTVHGALPNTSDRERLGYVLSYLTPPVKRQLPRDFPWLRDLRRDVRKNRVAFLLRGGALGEIFRILRSDRYSDRHFLAGFATRRFKSIARRLKRLTGGT